MAKKKPQVSITVALNDKPALEGLKALTDKFLDFSKRWQPAADIASKALGSLRAFAGGVTDAISASTSRSIEFEKSLRKVATIADSTAMPLSKIRAISYDLAGVYGGGLSANAADLYEILSAGITDTARATEALTSVNKLAIGGDADRATVVKGLTAIMNAYAGANVRSKEVADAFFVAAKDGSTTIEELSAHLGAVAPIAYSAGLSLEELTAGVSALTLGGMKTSVASDYLRSAIVAVIKPSKEASETAKKLGVDFSSTALATRGLSGFLNDVVLKSGATREELAKLFGGTEALTAVLGLTNDHLRALNTGLEHQVQKAGAADAAYETMTSTLGFQIERYDALADAAKTSLGSAVTESESARKGLAAINDAIVKVVAYFDSEEGKKSINQFFDLILTFTAETIRVMGRLAEVVTEPGRAMEKAWARWTGGVYVEELSAAQKGFGGLVDLAEELASNLNKVAAHGGHLKVLGDDLVEATKKSAGFMGPVQPPSQKRGPSDSGDQSMAERQKRAEQAALDADRMRSRGTDPEVLEAKLRADGLNEIDNQRLKDQRSYEDAKLEIQRQRTADAYALQQQEADNKRDALNTLRDFGAAELSMLKGIKSLAQEGWSALTGKDAKDAAKAITGIVSVISGAFTSLFVDIAKAIGSGDMDAALDALGGFLGNLLTQIGEMAIAMGTVLGILGLLGSLGVPGFTEFAPALPFVPALIGGGMVAVAAGEALGGSSHGSSGGGGGARSSGFSPSAANDRSRYTSGYRRGNEVESTTAAASGVSRTGPRGDSEPRTITINTHVHIGRHAVVGSAAQVGREVRGYLREEARLRGGELGRRRWA